MSAQNSLWSREARASAYRFPDGGAYRIEIPSVEGPEALEAIIEEAELLDVPVHRVSQGSEVLMLINAEGGPQSAGQQTRGEHTRRGHARCAPSTTAYPSLLPSSCGAADREDGTWSL